MKTKQTKITQMVQLALLAAILVILTVTNLGFINYGVVSITILHIPVIIGSILLGAKNGGILGLTFGIISMVNATVRGVTPVDLMFSPFVSGAPVQSVILCIIPRIILGILPALLFKQLHKVMKKTPIPIAGNAAVAVSAAVSTIVHTILVLGCLYFLFFGNMSFGEIVKSIFLTVIGINGLIETGAAAIIAGAVCIPLRHITLAEG